MPHRCFTFRRANRAVASMCNHQRNVPQTYEKSLEVMEKKLEAKQQYMEEAVRRNRSQEYIAKLALKIEEMDIKVIDKEEGKSAAVNTSNKKLYRLSWGGVPKKNSDKLIPLALRVPIQDTKTKN